MSVELKPCPWCRSAAAIHWRAGTAFASCEDLGCVGSDLAADPTAWNTRAPEPNQARIEALEAEVERLRGALEPFADIADLIDCETEGFSETDELQLNFNDYLFQNFSVAAFKTARAALESRHENV